MSGADGVPVLVAVVGPHACDDRLYRLAYEVGRLLGEAGIVVATGGGSGVMEAASRGAYEAGAVTVGFLPGADPAEGNRYLTVPLTTGLGEGRNVLLVAGARAVIGVGSSWGTESEIALAVRTGRPVVTMDGWTRTDVDGRPVGGVTVVTEPAQAVAAALDRVGPMTSGTG